jgi:hypothetical protein
MPTLLNLFLEIESERTLMKPILHSSQNQMGHNNNKKELQANPFNEHRCKNIQ